MRYGYILKRFLKWSYQELLNGFKVDCEKEELKMRFWPESEMRRNIRAIGFQCKIRGSLGGDRGLVDTLDILLGIH